MSNFDKIVKLACKPKNAPPKPKYTDVLVSATYSDDGSLTDIIRSLSLRLREPNAVVVFKALITLHTMVRTGSTDTLLENLSKQDGLKLRNIQGQNWDGYTPPSNLANYASYLDTRIRAWRELKHDLVTVQTESNRRSNGLSADSKARRLRHLPVDKGLLREVKQVQRILDSLITCRFYDDDLRDENTVIAFRMLIKDLLVLFQAGNEGVCNILEHYFEMSKVDATESFAIYKSFIKQTDRVVDFLGVARKLHNVLNVPVPNLKHAPTGLVKALEEYLNDPNFEENRMEYKRSLGVVEGKPGAASDPSPAPAAKKEEPKPSASASASTSTAPPPSSSSAPSQPPPGSNQKIQDFFDSIQADQQPTMFGGPPQQIDFSQVAPQFNPFRQSMMLPQQTGFMAPQMTGFPGMPPPHQAAQQPFLQPQATGQMAFGSMNNRQSMFPPQQQPQNPFPPQQPPQQQPFFQPQHTGFMPSQQTGFAQPHPQPLQAQQTGPNPFRQSMFPLNTNANPSGALSQPSSPFGNKSTMPSFGGGVAQIQRPGSTPALSTMGDAKPLTAQATGSKNPFAPPGGVTASLSKKPDAQPKGPSLNELAWGKMQGQFTGQGLQQQSQPQMNEFGVFGAGGGGGGGASQWGTGLASGKPSSLIGGGSGGMSDIASAFALDSSKTGSTGQNTSSGTSDFFSQFGSGLSTNPTGSTSPGVGVGAGGMQPQSTGGFLQPQPTGFGGSTVKRFQPTSSFGSQLLDSLPSIPEPSPSPQAGAPGSQGGGGVQSQSTGFPGFSGGAFGQGQGQGQGGMQAQQTGGGGMANPFRQSMFPQSTGQQPFGGGSGAMQPFGNGGLHGMGGGGGGGGGGAFGMSSPFAGQNVRNGAQGQGQAQGGQQGQGQGMGSLI